jgi:acyl-CoA synthetase (AMP-forming)/AMP-acid ligase II
VPALLITDRPVVAALDIPERIQVMMREDFQRLALASTPEPIAAPGEPHHTAIQLFTSGTTGKPKAAVLRHENLMSYILGTVEFASAAEEDGILISVPPYHIAGISAVLSSTYAGRRMVQLYDHGEGDEAMIPCSVFMRQ